MHTKGKILHLFGWDKKFVLPYIKFVRQNFDETAHGFIIYGKNAGDDPIPAGENVVYYPSVIKNILRLLAQLRGARIIILHGLFSSHLFYILALHPWVLKKCYWAIWGGDLYIHKSIKKDWRSRKSEWLRRFVISRLGHFITHIEGDYKLAQQWYGAKGQWHECFMYPSNLYKSYPIQDKEHNAVNILVGNSSDPSNHHLEILEMLKAYRDQSIKIYVPLSYGDQQHAQVVSKYGYENFGDVFIPLTEFISFDKYLELLSGIDIAIFNHRRQQGMGNTTTLLGLGKKVYMRSDVTPWAMFMSIGVKIFDVAEFNLELIEIDVRRANEEHIKNYFSESELSLRLKYIFEG